MPTNKTTLNLPAGKRLIVVADSISRGTFCRVDSGAQYTPKAINEGQTRYAGPFGESRNYEIVSEVGLLTATASDVNDLVTSTGASVSGMVGNLSVIADGQELTLPEDAQSQVFVSMTVNGSITVNGELRVGAAWPT